MICDGHGALTPGQKGCNPEPCGKGRAFVVQYEYQGTRATVAAPTSVATKQSCPRPACIAGIWAPPSRCPAWYCCWACWLALGTGPAHAPVGRMPTSRRAFSTSTFQARPPVPGTVVRLAAWPRPGPQARQTRAWLPRLRRRCPRSSATCQPDAACRSLKQPQSSSQQPSGSGSGGEACAAALCPLFPFRGLLNVCPLFAYPQLVV